VGENCIWHYTAADALFGLLCTGVAGTLLETCSPPPFSSSEHAMDNRARGKQPSSKPQESQAPWIPSRKVAAASEELKEEAALMLEEAALMLEEATLLQRESQQRLAQSIKLLTR